MCTMVLCFPQRLEIVKIIGLIVPCVSKYSSFAHFCLSNSISKVECMQ